MEQLTRVSKHLSLLCCITWITLIGRHDAVCPQTSFQVAKFCSSTTATGSRVFLDGSQIAAADTTCTCRLVTSGQKLEVTVLSAPGGIECRSQVVFQSSVAVTFACVQSGSVIDTHIKKEFDVVFSKSSSSFSNYCLDVKAKTLTTDGEATVSLVCEPRTVKTTTERKHKTTLETQEISTETAVIPPDPSLTTEEIPTTLSKQTTTPVGNTTAETTTPLTNTNIVTSPVVPSGSTSSGPKADESRSAGLDTTIIIIIAVVAGVIVIAGVVIFVVVYFSRRKQHGTDVRGHNYVYYNDGADVDDDNRMKGKSNGSNEKMDGETRDTTHDNVVLVSEKHDVVSSIQE